MNAPTPNRSYYPALDGIRGLAILLVVFYHNFNFIPYSSFGWIGVDLFFVLSGFLITDILLLTKGSKNFLANFYVRRSLRIFPLYYAALLLFFILGPAASQLSDQLAYYSDHKAMTFLHFQNWLYILHEKPSDAMIFGHFWSLSVEEQYYLVWPLLILGIHKKKHLLWITILILLAFIILRYGSWIYNGAGYTNFHFQFMTRMDGLCIGSLLAIWRHLDAPLSWKRFSRFCLACLGLHVVAWIVLRLIMQTEFPHFSIFGYTSIAAIFGLLVGASVRYRNRITGIFELGILKFLGKISYGLYVIHWPVLMLFRIYLPDLAQTTDKWGLPGGIILSVLAITVAVVFSVLSYYLFERRFLALKDKFTSKEWLTKMRRRILFLNRP